jgi:hypothetical protein
MKMSNAIYLKIQDSLLAAHEFYADEFDKICQQTKTFKVFNTEAIAIQFQQITRNPYNTTIDEAKWLYEI